MRNMVTINKTNPGLWRQDKNQYLDGSSVDNRALLDLSRMDDAQRKTVVAGFVSMGKENGIPFYVSMLGERRSECAKEQGHRLGGLGATRGRHQESPRA